MKNLLIIFIVSFVMTSCVESYNNEKPLFNVNGYLDAKSGNIKLSDIFTNFRIVPLETNNYSIIGGRGNKIIQRDSLFFIQSDNSVLCFGSDGRFVYRFNKQGSGPHDYIYISDFDIVSSEIGKSELWISGPGGIQIYDAANRTHLRKIYLKEHVHQFKYVNKNTILLITTGEKMFQVCNNEGIIRKSFMDRDLANSVHKFCQFFKWDGNIAYQLGDTQTAIVYSIQKDELSLQPVLLPEKNVLTPYISSKYYNQYGYLKQYDKMTEDYTLLLDIRASIDKAILTWVSPRNNRLLTIISPTTYNTYCFSDIINDIFSSHDNLFLSTLTGCESDVPNRLLFKIPSQRQSGEEDNFWLLEVDM